MSRETTQFTLRIDTGLWEEVKKIAQDNKRSAVKQVEFILEEFVNKNKK